ncbi:hypothetical protein [Maribellus sediminis]|uniref:hypothetical protein n=1 Tax=Maribellus sediminis TaxID=2696285 RepID=UPI00142F8E6B|nr:hypothetical protein [Maribellus sediminis]
MTSNADTIILKSTSKGIVVDTVISSNDSLHLKADYQAIVSIPDNTIKVDLPEKSNLEIFSTWAIIIGGLAGLAGAIVAFWQLFRKDTLKQQQIEQLIHQTDELRKHTQIDEKRIKLQSRPILCINNLVDRQNNMFVEIYNWGEFCYVDECILIDGIMPTIKIKQGMAVLPKKQTHTIEMPLRGNTLKDYQFTLMIYYRDYINNKYESKFFIGKEKILSYETNEL